MTAETLYWLFSTVAQTYGAIVGIIGMLTVYKLQIIRNKKTEIIKQTDRQLQYFFDYKRFTMTPEDIVYAWETGNYDKRNNADTAIMDNLIKEIKQVNKVTKEIKTSFKAFLVYHLAMITISMVCLLQTEILETSNIRITLAISTIFIISFILTTILCYSLLKE